MSEASHEQNANSFIEVNSSGQFVVGGVLNFDTVLPLYTRGCQLIAASPLPVFDMKLVAKSDNAGLALIIAWLRYAKIVRKTAKFINMPPQLSALVELCALQQVIPVG